MYTRMYATVYDNRPAHPPRLSPTSSTSTTTCGYAIDRREQGEARADGRVNIMFRWLTAGESHGRALAAICDGVPAGVRVTSEDVAQALARRRAGYGRGARMKFEQDEVELTGG